MPLLTSTQFASTAASGTDWRDTSKKILEDLVDIKTKESGFNLGFLYISDHLAADATSILNLFKSVLNIEHWVGCVGIGICGNGEAFVDVPAISAMIGRFEDSSFCVFPGSDFEQEQTQERLEPWLDSNDPLLVVVHNNPAGEEYPELAPQSIEQLTNGFVVGGLTSSRKEHFQFADDIFESGLSGVAFSQDIPVATTISQGCVPIGPIHTITKADEYIVYEINSEPAVNVFENDLRSMVIKKTDRDPNTILIDKDVIKKKEIPKEFGNLFKGEAHAAFPVSGSDQNNYLVRNILGLDKEEGALAVSQTVSHGDPMVFVYRDGETVQQDLSKSLINLRERVQKDTGSFEPKGALYISCIARAFSELKNNSSNEEMRLIREIIGDVPLAGFYASGEISNARVYGYAGILTLFL